MRLEETPPEAAGALEGPVEVVPVSADYIPAQLKPGGAALMAHCDELHIMREEKKILAGTAEVDGKVVVVLGEPFLRLSPEGKAEALEHEAMHVALGHATREQWRDALTTDGVKLFNICCDAAIHHNLGVDHTVIDKEVGWQSITYEKLGVPPAPPEIVYDWLYKKWEKVPMPSPGSGCGREKVSKDTDALSPKMMAAAVACNAASMGLRAGRGDGMGRNVPPIPPPPAWACQLEDHLKQHRWGRERGRSWARENRHNDLLPARNRKRRREGLVLIDVSGSMTEDDLGLGLSIIQGFLPECEVVFWSHSVSERVPVADALKSLSEFKGAGGGTNALAAGAVRKESDEAIIWFSDGYVGQWPPLDERDLMVLSRKDGNRPLAKTIYVEDK